MTACYPFTPKVKRYVIQSFLTFVSIDRPLIAKLLSSTLLWYCLFFNFLQLVILKNLLNFENFGLDTVRSERVNGVRVQYSQTFENNIDCSLTCEAHWFKEAHSLEDTGSFLHPLFSNFSRKRE